MSPEENNGYNDPRALPLVSVVIPVYNEVHFIEACLQAVLHQEYPEDKLEIVVVDGVSTDGSTNLVQESFIDRDAPVTLLSNPNRQTAQSLNIGIRKSRGDVVIILGAHTEIFPDFLKFNVENLRQFEIACSGGTQINTGHTKKQSSIGEAMSHWFGITTAPYRYKQQSGFVNTVVYGAYHRWVFEKVGFFEEEVFISEDADLNWRIIEAGYKIYFDPRIKTRYYPRENFVQLARQLYCYGIRRAHMYRKHLKGLSWLHFVPPFFVFCIMILSIGSIFWIIPRPFLLLLIMGYCSLALFFGFVAGRKDKGINPLLISLAFVTMHFAWGASFLLHFFRRK